MSIVYTLSVPASGLLVERVENHADVVTRITYILTAKDGEHVAEITQSVEIKLNTGNSFVPFDQLTEAQVVEWIKSQVPPDQMLVFETILARQIERKKNPPPIPQRKLAPWATNA